MEKFLQLSVIASTFLIINAASNDRPSYIGCADSSECGKEKCCTLGMGRNSTPKCSEMLDLGASCMPDNKRKKSLILSYPNNYTVLLTNFYSNLCPCKSSLICSRMTGKCENPNSDAQSTEKYQ